MKKYAFTNGVILDGTENMTPLTGKTVIVEKGRIAAIVADTEKVTDAEVIDLKGAYLLPGLINLHVHLASAGKPIQKNAKPKDYRKIFKLVTGNALTLSVFKKLTYQNARTQLMSGVTTIRTMGGVLGLDGEVRDAILSGKKIGPRILSSNTAISVPGGHFAGSIATEALSAEHAVELVRQTAATKPDLIKLMITGGVMDSSEDGEPGRVRMSPDIVKAACDEAHRLGYKVAAHVECPDGVRIALECGVDTIEHGARLTDEMTDLFKERGAADVCTISPALPYVVFELSESHVEEVARSNGRIVMDGIIESAAKCREGNISVGLGNDAGCPFVTHYSFWRELYYFHKYVGVSNAEALYRATLGNARIADLDQETGSIQPGKAADLIVVAKNPLEDLSALREVSMVMARGDLIRHPKVKRMQAADTLLDKYM